jgi:HSP20 family protein
MATDTRSRTEPRSTEPAIERAPETRDAAQHDSPHRPSYSPFSIMRQGIDEMDRWWSRLTAPGEWSPAIEAFQRGNEFVVRAEVPGMHRKDLTIEAGDDSVTIRGERRQERQEDRDGVFWTERSYGTFTRVIPLPPGAITESAKATFTNGVLEIVMQAPSSETRRGRRIAISGQEVDEKT